MSVYIRLFHGRNSVDEILEDWGFDGPTLGPFPYVHTTYAWDIKWADTNGLQHVTLVDEMFPWEGKFYGDWSITSDDAPEA